MVNKNALDDIRVVELASMVAGPYCGKLLADMGADVIKVEPPEGDPSRLSGPFPQNTADKECSALFLYNNTSKRGITLNLALPENHDVLRRLINWADVLIDDHSPSFLDNLGFDWKTMQVINPELIVASITPYGRTGPRAVVKGDELTIIHAAGLGNLLPVRSENTERPPVKLGGYAVGYSGGTTAAFAIMGALFGRLASGCGQLIDISLQEVILNLVRTNLAGARYNNMSWSRVPDRPPALGRMKTSDGYLVMAAQYEDHHFKALMEMMGNPEWASAPEWLNRVYRTSHLQETATKFGEWMAHQKKDEIHHIAAKKGIPVGPVNSMRDVMNDEQYNARKYFVEVDHPKAGKLKYAGWPFPMTVTPPQIQRPPPLLGEHNREILCDVLGYSSSEFEGIMKKENSFEK